MVMFKSAMFRRRASRLGEVIPITNVRDHFESDFARGKATHEDNDGPKRKQASPIKRKRPATITPGQGVAVEEFGTPAAVIDSGIGVSSELEGPNPRTQVPEGSRDAFQSAPTAASEPEPTEPLNPKEVAEAIISNPATDYIVDSYGLDDEVLKRALRDHYKKEFPDSNIQEAVDIVMAMLLTPADSPSERLESPDPQVDHSDPQMESMV
jgi:hypothetical protein